VTKEQEFEKKDYVKIRISSIQKAKWKKACLDKKISLTSLVISSVENRLTDDERRKVIGFIEKQENIFVKIETNINQIARIVNTQKFMSESEFEYFRKQLEKITLLKDQQNEIFLKIYSLLADDC